MKAYTTWDRILDFIWRDRIRKIEYYFAKRWLDKNFGEQEYWGEVISEWYSVYKNLTEAQNIKNWRDEFKKLYGMCYGDSRSQQYEDFINQLLSEATREAVEKAHKYMDEVDYENYKIELHPKDPITNPNN